MPLVNLDRVQIISKALMHTDLKPMNLFDTKFYPNRDEPLDRVLMYFMVMVSMDHRLSRPGKQYRASVDGEELHGADLLYRLGMKMYSENSEFFDPRNLIKVEPQDVISWLSIGNASPPDPDVRSMLLRDLGSKMLKLFEGDPLKILHTAGNRLKRDDGNGFLELIKVFKAYQDPVEKKGMLLAKFLSYRGILRITDVENKRVPVDNHLTRIAIRLGIVDLERIYIEKILHRVPFDKDEDVIIRYSVREAYRYLSLYSGVDPFHLDDALWTLGRTTCTKDRSKCSTCHFKRFCRAYLENQYLEEHLYLDTWYY